MKGCVSSVPFLNTRTMPLFVQMNMRPSGANVSPAGVKGESVVTSSDTNPGSLNVCAPARRGDSDSAIANAAARRSGAPRHTLAHAIELWGAAMFAEVWGYREATVVTYRSGSLPDRLWMLQEGWLWASAASPASTRSSQISRQNGRNARGQFA